MSPSARFIRTLGLCERHRGWGRSASGFLIWPDLGLKGTYMQQTNAVFGPVVGSTRVVWLCSAFYSFMLARSYLVWWIVFCQATSFTLSITIKKAYSCVTLPYSKKIVEKFCDLFKYKHFAELILRLRILIFHVCVWKVCALVWGWMFSNIGFHCCIYIYSIALLDRAVGILACNMAVLYVVSFPFWSSSS